MRNIFIVVLLLLLTSCSFHWRNANALSPQWHKIYLTNRAAHHFLAQDLQQVGIQLVDNPADAKITLTILRDFFVEKSQLLGIGQQLNEMNITYHVTLAMRTPTGEDQNFPVNFSTDSTHLQNASHVLADMTALPHIKAQLKEAMAEKITAYLVSTHAY